MIKILITNNKKQSADGKKGNCKKETKKYRKKIKNKDLNILTRNKKIVQYKERVYLLYNKGRIANLRNYRRYRTMQESF